MHNPEKRYSEIKQLRDIQFSKDAEKKIVRVRCQYIDPSLYGVFHNGVPVYMDRDSDRLLKQGSEYSLSVADVARIVYSNAGSPRYIDLDNSSSTDLSFAQHLSALQLRSTKRSTQHSSISDFDIDHKFTGSDQAMRRFKEMKKNNEEYVHLNIWLVPLENSCKELECLLETEQQGGLYAKEYSF